MQFAELPHGNLRAAAVFGIQTFAEELVTLAVRFFRMLAMHAYESRDRHQSWLSWRSAQRNVRPMRFAHGQFYGSFEARRQVDEVALAELQPSVPEDLVEPHTHQDGHLLLLLDGCYLSTAEGMPTQCTGATLILNPPGTHHRDRFRGEGGRFFTISFPSARWALASEKRALTGHARRLGASALAHATALLDELRHWDDASPLAVQSGFELLLDETAIDARVGATDGPRWLERVRERLADEWRTSPAIGDLAAICDVHPVYLARCFRRRFGCSPAEYLRRCRLERALSLLAQPQLAMTEIAVTCGFVDHSHFTHAFKRRYRLAPSRFRQVACVQASAVRR